MDNGLLEYLKEHSIEYKEYKHPAVFTVQESSKLTELIPGIRTKSLFLKDESDNYYLITLKGEKRLNTKALKAHLGIKELHFSSPQEMHKELNITPGSVSLFCIINSNNTMLILDKEVWDAKEAGFHPNVNTSTIVLDHSNIEKFYNSIKCRKEIIKLE